MKKIMKSWGKKMKDLSFHFVTRGNKYEFSLSEEKEKL